MDKVLIYNKFGWPPWFANIDVAINLALELYALEELFREEIKTYKRRGPMNYEGSIVWQYPSES